MPKRKRIYEDEKSLQHDSANSSGRALEAQKKQVEQHVTIGKKALGKALKLAKGFERQKLGRRLKEARTKKDEADIMRLEREIEVLKELKLPDLAERHIYKSLSKSKPISSSPGFPEWIAPAATRSQVNTEFEKLARQSARNNVTARLYNSNPVKAVMVDIIKGIRIVLGLDVMVEDRKRIQEGYEDMKGHDSDNKPLASARTAMPEAPRGQATLLSSLEDDTLDEFEGFSDPIDIGVELEDEGFAKYDDRIASSSDDEDEEGEGKRGDTGDDKDAQERNRLTHELYDHEADISLSSASSGGSSSPPQPSKTQGKRKLTQVPNSMFIPSLMGGYWSGSESGEDDEVANIQPRKNRMGQQARRQLWEKKYGMKANHLKGAARDRDWDPTRRARPTNGRDNGLRFNKVDAQSVGTSKNYSGSTNAQAGSGAPGKPGMADKTEPLHPSWEAARKAKAEAKQAMFQGKRIVFD